MTERERKIYDELVLILKKTGNKEKHRGYHIIPERLNSRLEEESLKSRFVFYERERLSFIKSKLNIAGKKVLDIGCNTGYILFDLLDSGASDVTGYEGKLLCAEFLNKAIELFGEEKRFHFYNRYYEFNKINEVFDIIVLLNVLHHVGDDYGDKNLNIKYAKDKILEQLNSLADSSRNLVFQMGFNWQGNINQCLFEYGTKGEMIQFVKEGIQGNWEIVSIGIPEKIAGKVEYKELNELNIKRDDSLGEFLNRPLFIMKSLKHSDGKY